MKTFFSAVFLLLLVSFAKAHPIPAYLLEKEREIKNPGAECWKNMTYIPGGTYTQMNLTQDEQEYPAMATLSGFCLQKYEVTNRWYKYFLYDLAQTDPGSVQDMMPDTASWVNDFRYSYNEPMKLLYFKHAAYDNYPVVGVSYRQARAFASWANQKLQQYLRGKNIKNAPVSLRLPTVAEWQYAATGGMEQTCYGFEKGKDTWGACSVFSLLDLEKRKFRANYKNDDGLFMADGFFHTGPVGSFAPNPYGLYDMIGNVSEWTADAYRPYTPEHSGTQSAPATTDGNLYTVEGGSFVHGYKEQRIGYAFSLAADSSHCFVGFRLAADVKGN